MVCTRKGLNSKILKLISTSVAHVCVAGLVFSRFTEGVINRVSVNKGGGLFQTCYKKSLQYRGGYCLGDEEAFVKEKLKELAADLRTRIGGFSTFNRAILIRCGWFRRIVDNGGSERRISEKHYRWLFTSAHSFVDNSHVK